MIFLEKEFNEWWESQGYDVYHFAMVCSGVPDLKRCAYKAYLAGQEKAIDRAIEMKKKMKTSKKSPLKIPRELIQPVSNYNTENVYEFMREVVIKLSELFKQKDKAYAGSWQARGVLSAQLNLERKMDRIRAQFESGAMFADQSGENITDTLIDNAVYSLLYLWYLNEKDEKVREFIKKFLEE